MGRLEWTTRSRRDVDDIYDYIARGDNRPATADKFIDDLGAACASYAEAFASGSLIGAPQPKWGDDAQCFTHKRWVVIFRPIVGGIEILRVVDGSRDIPRLLGD